MKIRYLIPLYTAVGFVSLVSTAAIMRRYPPAEGLFAAFAFQIVLIFMWLRLTEVARTYT